MKNKKDKIHHEIELLRTLEQAIRERKTIDTDAGYLHLKKKIKKNTYRHFTLKVLNRAAAVIAIPLLITTAVLLNKVLNQEDTAQTFIEITTSPGTIKKIQLPDLSEVWLNSESTLRYPSQFTTSKREVYLTGEAFFKVNASPRHLFEVTTPSGTKIVAKGTSFNISAYPDELIHEIVLEAGVVDVTHKEAIFSLQPSDIVYFHTQTELLTKDHINIEEKTDWKDGTIIFRNTPLDEVFKKLSRRFNIDFILHRDAGVDYKIRATFSSETITQILDVLKIAAPLDWSVKEIEQNKDLTFSRRQVEVWIK